MSTQEMHVPDFAAPDLNGDQIPEDEYELVQWYERPGWPFGKITPNVAVAGAFAVGILVGVGVMGIAAVIRDQLDD